MKPLHKSVVVAGGYIAALLIAIAAVAARNATIDPQDAQASSGMYAFGDALLFVAVFGICALAPTGAMLYFLRTNRRVWTVLSTSGLIVASTGVVATIVYAFGRDATASALANWANFSVLRILVAPLLALTFAVCAMVAAEPAPRRMLLVAALLECAVSAYAGIVWFAPLIFEQR